MERLLRRAWQRGVNMIDTSGSYGNGYVQEILGLILRNNTRDFIIFAKIGLVEDGSYRGCWDSLSLRRAIDRTLMSLGRTSVDVLALHSPPPAVAGRDDVWRVIEDARREGKAKYIGLSTDAEPEVVRMGILRRVDVIQVRYNLLYRETRGMIEDAYRSGVGVMVNSALAHGFLSGRYRDYTEIPEGEYPKGPFRETRSQAVIEAALERARQLEHFAGSVGLALPELAIRFAATPEGVSSVVVGQRTLEELEENVVATCKGALPRGIQGDVEDFVRQIDQ